MTRAEPDRTTPSAPIVDSVRARTYRALAGLLGLGLMTWRLFPYDFITDSPSLHAAFRRAGWIPDDLSAWWKAAIQDLPQVAWFFLLGGLGVRGCGARGVKRAFVGSVINGWIFVVLIELLQLLSRFHAFDLMDILRGATAVFLGAGVAAFGAARRASPPYISREPHRVLCNDTTVSTLSSISMKNHQCTWLHLKPQILSHFTPINHLRHSERGEMRNYR